jgi:hypothetical protein
LDHGNNVNRHGFYEDDPPWSLDVRTKDPGDHKTRPTIECPKCHAIYRGGKCRHCGYEPTPRERRGQGLEFDGRELREVVRKERTVTEKTPEQLMISALYMAGKSGQTWKQAVGIYFRACEKQGQKHRVPTTVTVAGKRYAMLRYGDSNSGRRVAAMFPFTVGRSGGEMREEQPSFSEAF